MSDIRTAPTSLKRWALIISFGMALILLVLVSASLSAQESEIQGGDPVLSTSLKVVDTATASPDSTLQYTVFISNTGTGPALDVVMTDTLPPDLSYVAGSLTVQGGGNSGASGDVITWTGFINNSDAIAISFDALLAETAPVSTFITNTAIVDASNMPGGQPLELPVGVYVLENRSVLMPIMSQPIPEPILSPIVVQDYGVWSVQWTNPLPLQITGFELQESLNDPAFSNPTVIDTGLALGVVRTQTDPGLYYYRVRAEGASWGSGPWSNVEGTDLPLAEYYDDFSDPGSGWAMRRQDTDDIDNKDYYRNGRFVLEIDGRWDYQIGSPLVMSVAPPFEIETEVRLTGVDNLHTYGIVWGADWNGDTCPDIPEYLTCFNHYYRLLMLWHGAPSSMVMQLKRIDYHDYPAGNVGRGSTLIDWMDVSVHSPPESDQVWKVRHEADGRITVYANSNLVASATDSTYLNEPYFGVIAASNEYSGLEAEYDWYVVSPLDTNSPEMLALDALVDQLDMSQGQLTPEQLAIVEQFERDVIE